MSHSVVRNLIFKVGWDTRCRNRDVASALSTLASDAGPVLDAGSGEYGLSTFLRSRKVIGADVSLPAHYRTAGSFVRASIMALPFAGASFPAVASVDVMEHLSPAARDAAIAELVRVGRAAAVIAFPCGTRAERTDRSYHDRLVAIGNRPPEWLVEHLQHPYPSVDRVLASLSSEAAASERALDARVFYCEHIAVTRALRWAASRSRLLYVGMNVLAGLCMAMVPRPGRGNSYRAVIVATFRRP